MVILSPPQGYLDAIREANAAALFVPGITDKQRQNLINRCRELLHDTRRVLNSEMQALSGSKRGSTPDAAAALQLKPYQLISSLMDRIDAAINELESRMQNGQMLPQPIQYDTVIFGSPQRGEWFLGSSEDSDRWDLNEQNRRRLASLRNERDLLQKEIGIIRAKLQQASADLKKQMARYQKRKRRRGTVLLVLALLALALFMGFIGVYAYFVLANLSGSIGLGLALALLLLIPVLIRLRRRGLSNLRESIQALRQDVAQLRHEGKNQQLRLFPMVELVRETETEYRRLRASFARLEQIS